MSETPETAAQHIVSGSNKALTLFVLALLGVALLLWSVALPIVGILYLVGVLN